MTPAVGQISHIAMVRTGDEHGSQTASVLIHGDLQFEPNETFFVQLTQPVDARVGDGLAIGTILNDDGNFLITTGPTIGGASRVRRYRGN